MAGFWRTAFELVATGFQRVCKDEKKTESALEGHLGLELIHKCRELERSLADDWAYSSADVRLTGVH